MTSAPGIAAYAAAKAALKPFSDVIPHENIQHHFTAGVYAKEVHIPAGMLLVSHSHPHDHLSILASGRIVLTVNGVATEMTGPRAINILARHEHTVVALTDSVWFCIHATEETDPAKVDGAILGGG